MRAHVPSFWKQETKSNLPWLTDECRDAIAAKHSAEGTSSYPEVAAWTTEVLRRVRGTYFVKLRYEMAHLPRCSKRWWALNKQLLNKQASPPLFPPLKAKSGAWCRTPASKANAFVETWLDKCMSPPETHEHFFHVVPDRMPHHFAIRTRHVRLLLKSLRQDQATGPDGFSAVLLKTLAKELSLPIAILARRIFGEGHWPQQWRLHHIIPIFKRGSAFLPGQYRGVHLTSILSKTVERVLGSPLTSFLEQHGYGNAQWAFRKKCSARDMVLMCVARWVLLICQGKKIGLYLSDIAGAFDRVSRHLLMGKLAQLGLPATFLDFLNSFLLPREGRVRVEGALSDVMLLCDMVFQGTVLGPPLWNTFFADVADHVPQGRQQIELFADDLSVSTWTPHDTSPAVLMDELQEVQARTHMWGGRNQVQFDPSKEHFKIVHPIHGEGDDFKLLGTLLDCRLSMVPCIQELLSKFRPKMRALLRLQHLYTQETMLGQYKTHIWSSKEYSNGALIMAAPSQLLRLDKAQRWYLHQLGLSDSEAFTKFNFAPPSIRRAIGMLGFLHKRTLGLCHPSLRDLLPVAVGLDADYHSKALDPFSGEVIFQRRLYERSLYAYILIDCRRRPWTCRLCLPSKLSSRTWPRVDRRSTRRIGGARSKVLLMWYECFTADRPRLGLACIVAHTYPNLF